MLAARRVILGWLSLALCVAGACGGESIRNIEASGAPGGQGADTSGGQGADTSGGQGADSTGAIGSGAKGAGGSGTGGSHASGGASATGGSSARGGSQVGGSPSKGGASSGARPSGGFGAFAGSATAGSQSIPRGGAGLGGSAGDGAAPGDAGDGSAGAPDGCGDGVITTSEACDDGNQLDGDGCSRQCAVEAGFVCSAARCDASGHCTLRVPTVFRDFIAHDQTGGHPDFQPGFAASDAIQGLVESVLDDEGKPVQTSSASVQNGFMHGKEAFAEWYRDGSPSGGPIPGELVLWKDGTGDRYVNRWGAHGEQWLGQSSGDAFDPILYGGPGGTGCPACTPSATGACYDPCIAWPGSTPSCCAEIPANLKAYDGTPLFFPIDAGKGLLEETTWAAKIPPQYGWDGWRFESDVAGTMGVMVQFATAFAPFPSSTHNFNFTTELSYSFRYDASRTIVFELAGDDDSWLFINGHLAIDLGGWHSPLSGTATLSNGTLEASAVLIDDGYGNPSYTATTEFSAESLGLVDGDVYLVQLFNAEREISGSSLRFGVTGVDASRSACAKAP